MGNIRATVVGNSLCCKEILLLKPYNERANLCKMGFRNYHKYVIREKISIYKLAFPTPWEISEHSVSDICFFWKEILLLSPYDERATLWNKVFWKNYH